MIDLESLIAARLKAEVADLVGVEGALELSALIAAKTLPQRVPAAYVIPVSERGQPPEGGSQITSQTIDQVVAVVLYSRVEDDPTGKKAAARLGPVKWLVIQALHGWSPADGFDGLAYQGMSATTNAAGVFLQLNWGLRFTLRDGRAF